MNILDGKPQNSEGILETLLVGDDLGCLERFNFFKNDWHSCEYNIWSKDKMTCH
jgi:hypothetical protein